MKNCIKKALVNEYGSNYGREYIIFPPTETKKILNRIRMGRELTINPQVYFFTEEEIREIEQENSGSVWDQTNLIEVDSFKEAINLYLK